MRPLPAGRARQVGAFATLAVVLALTGIGLARVHIDTGVKSFLPDGADSTALQNKAESFGGDPVVVLLTAKDDDALLLDPDNLARLLGLEGQLAGQADVAAVYGPATVLNQTAGAIQDLLAEISGRRDALSAEVTQQALAQGASKAQAAARASTALAKYDQRYGSLIVRGLPAGLPTLKNPKFVASVVFDASGTPKDTWRFLVPQSRTVTILVRPREGLDQAGAAHLNDRVRAVVKASGLPLQRTIVTGVPVLTAAVAEQARTEMLRLGGAAAVAVALVLLLMPWRKRGAARLLPMLAAGLGAAATLGGFGLLGQSVSLGVVAFLPILLGIGSDFPVYLLQGGDTRRILVAGLAALVAFGSLAFSSLPFVRELGIALALGIAATIAVALLLRAAFSPSESLAPSPSEAEEAIAPAKRRPLAKAGLALALAVAAVGWALLPGLQLQTQVEALAKGLPAMNDVNRAADILGSTGEMSVVVTGPNVLSPQAFEWSQRASGAIARGYSDQLHPILTLPGILAFLGQKPSAEQIQAAFDILPRYLTSAVVSDDGKSAVLTYGVESDDVTEQGRLFKDVDAALPPLPSGFHAELVGLPVAAATAVDAASTSRIWINVAGILLAVLVLLVGLRGERRVAVAAAASAVISTGMLILASAAFSGSLTPLTVAVGSLLAATSCEFTVILTSSQTGTRFTTSAMTAALAATFGYVVLAFSDLAVLREFGGLLAASVVLSFLSALLTTWALGFRRAPVLTFRTTSGGTPA